MAQDKADNTETVEVAAECLGVKVPASQFLHEGRIERINKAQYEGQEIKGALHVVQEGDRVLEVGSGLGIVGAVVALNRKPATVRSFEANPALIPHIRKLYEINGLQDRIGVENAVLISASDRPKDMPFYVMNSYLGSSLSKSGRAREVVNVPTASFAEVMADLKPTVLIMDIEGGELELLQHADLGGIRAVVLEFHPKAYGDTGMQACKTILREAGFQRIEALSTRTVWTCERKV